EGTVDRRGARPFRVLQIVPALDAGGVERTAVDIAAGLAARGCTALVASQGGRLTGELESVGGRHVTLPLASKNPAVMLANARRLQRLIARERIDIVHARSRAPAWSALMAARATSRAFVTTYHGAYGQGIGIAGAMKGVYNGVMARGDVVIANSGFTRDLILARHGPDPSRVRVIHRGTDLARFDPGRVSDADIAARRGRWGLTAEERVVLLPGRLTGWKGHRVLLEAAATLAAPGIALVFVGDPQGRDGYVASLDNLAAERGLRLVLPGHDADMAPVYAAADIVVVPSTEPEAFGRTAVEAQAMGRPVIVADHGAMPETVIAPPEPGWTGWRTPPGDADALASALQEALSLDGASRAALSARARAQAARFGLARMVSQTLAVYDELLSAPSPRG
ncbi:MAG: glycosyltransferase family 4 protein, partial [Pseudomonadota bacterium]